jgi:5-methylcytosine-specific restriction endonuclease McrA
MSANKTCNKCLLTLPLIDFHKDKGSKDGLKNWCKSCQKVIDRAKYLRNKENPEKVQERRSDKLRRNRLLSEGKQECSNCLMILPLEKFHRSTKSISGRVEQCRKCRKIIAAEYQLKTAAHQRALDLEKEKMDLKKKNMKKCGKCGVAKKNTSFSETRWGLSSYCKNCAKIYRANHRHTEREMRSKTQTLRNKIIRKQLLEHFAANIYSKYCLACKSRENLTMEHLIPITRGGNHSEGNLATLCVSCNTSKNNLTWTEWKYSGRPRAVKVFGITR